MITQEEYKNALKVVNEYKLQLINERHRLFVELEMVESHVRIANLTPETPIFSSNISFRLMNVLKAGFDIDDSTPIKFFEGKSVKELLKFRSFGLKSINELQRLCSDAGVFLLP